MEKLNTYKVRIEEGGQSIDKYIYAYDIADAEEKAERIWTEKVLGVTLA